MFPAASHGKYPGIPKKNLKETPGPRLSRSVEQPG
jgi:hypothetical protein